MIRIVVIVFALLLGSNVKAQSLRVLVVPFDKFQFECPMSLKEIASYNEFSEPGQVHEAYTMALLEAMNSVSDSLAIYQLDENGIAQLRRQMPKIYKREPISHNGVEVKSLAENGQLQSFLKNMGADYLMVISRYKILGKLITARGNWDNSTGFISWSIHQVDYEIFNSEGKLVALADRFTINPRNPRSDNYTTEGTLLKDLRSGMQKLGLDVEQKLQKFEKKGKVVYRSKIK